MCGIAGFARFDGQVVTEGELQPLLRELAHRGPDGTGWIAREGLGLAMTRLAIIDVAGGQQPIFNEAGDMAIVCNGEIYNYQDLRAELERTGHRFRTHSDVESILHLYEDLGPDCFKRLNGMFGAAIADFRNRRLVLGRDAFGQKSLYVWRQGDKLYFASEQKAIARLPGFPRRLDAEALASYLEWRYVPAPQAIFEGVEKVQPGSWWTIDQRSGQTERRRYWQADYGPGSGDPPTDPERIADELEQAVARHLMSERPLGVFLSGGLDSSALVACMHSLGHRRIHTYSIGAPDHGDNELPAAESVARHFQTIHREVVITPENFWESFSPAVFSADEPMADLTMVPVYLLSKAAREDVVVVLSGEGSDELLAGYGGMETLQARFEHGSHWNALGKIAGGWWARRTSEVGYLERNAVAMTSVFDREYRRLHTRQEAYASGRMLEWLRTYYRERTGWAGVPAYLGALTEWWLPDDLLVKADRMSMAHSLELRSPFLDRSFADYCRRLPLSSKISSSPVEPNRKIALKKAFEKRLPPGIALQAKKGFAVPMYDWLRDRYADRLQESLAREDTLSAEVFTRPARQALAAAAVAGDHRAQHQAWSLLVLDEWGRHWL